jgi:uncharacterized protein
LLTLSLQINYIVSQLGLCQKALGGGYLSAFPSTTFDALENLENPWAPYYVEHKIMAGLWDIYTLTGNKQAYSIVLDMASYFIGRIKNVVAKYSIYRSVNFRFNVHYSLIFQFRWQEILDDEFGGMNDLMYQVYGVTRKHFF